MSEVVSEVAVKLAQDVLTRLPMTVEPTDSYEYFEFYDEELETGVNATVNDLHLKACEVCGQGAFAVAYLLGRDPEERIPHWGRLRAELEVAVGGETWRAIERAYEGWSDREGTGGGAWKERYPEPRQRLRAIAHNVVRNGGAFVKDDFYTKPEEAS